MRFLKIMMVVWLLSTLCVCAKAFAVDKIIFHLAIRCPEGYQAGVRVQASSSQCLNGAGSAIANAVSTNTPGKTVAVDIQAPSDAYYFQAHISDAGGQYYVYNNGSGLVATLATLHIQADDPSPTLFVIANIFAFVLAWGFGWKLAARPPVEIMA